MPDRIYATYTPTNVPDTFHTAIHYERRDASGKLIKHVVVEVQPEAKGLGDKAAGVLEEAFRKGDGTTRLGRMNARVEDLTYGDYRAGTDPNPPYEIKAEGDDLNPYLKRMQSYARDVNASGFAYRGQHQNSNSFASGALRAGELPPATGVGRDPMGPPGELLEFFAPGLNEPLERPVGPSDDPTRTPVFDTGAPPIRYLSSRVVSASPDRQAAGGRIVGSLPEDNSVVPSGLAGRIAALAGIDPANPDQHAPLGRSHLEGTAQPWLFRMLGDGTR